MELKTTELKLQTLNLEGVLKYGLILSSILIPLLISKPQLLVGSAINAILLIHTFRYGFKKTLPLYFLPSIASLSRGLLFGGFTPFLLYLLPFIIFSNMILGYIANTKKNLFSTLSGVLLKSLFLFSCTYILIQLTNLPNIFLSSMGYIQAVTGIVGGIIALTITKVTKA